MKTHTSIGTFALLALISISAPCLGQPRHHEHEEGEARRREEEFYRMRAYPFERIPQNARLEAVMASRAQDKPLKRGAGTAGANRWQPIGPFDAGGRVVSIAVHPTDGNTLWIAAADGGVWKSTDRGARWAPVMDSENAIAMGAVAVDPNNPAILYAGTGEAAVFIDSYAGAGIMKSTDGGSTWHGSGLTTVGAFSRIMVRPGNSNVVLAAAMKNNAGLYRSADGGHTWTRVVSTGVSDITINPANPDEVWIGAGDEGVMRSTDGGATFINSGTGIGGGTASVGRVSVQVAPSKPSVLYALADEFDFSLGYMSHIYKSTNSGSTWKVVMNNNPNILNYYGHAQGSYDNVIAVAPDNPDVVVAGGVVMVRSNDGGAHWTLIESELHTDHHALIFDPISPQRLYIGNDGGMYRSSDAGLTFDRISTGLAITQFYAMAIDQSKPDLTYGGTQDNGTITNSAGDFWEGGPGIVGGGDGFHVVVDPANPDIVYYEQPNGRIFQTHRSTGETVQFTDGIFLNDPSDAAAWSAPLILDPFHRDHLYCGRTRVYRYTPESGWTIISPPFRTPISALAASPLDSNIIYAGSGIGSGSTIFLSDGVPIGELKISTDGGATWLDRSTGTGLPNRIMTAIVPSPTDRCTAYITYSGFYSGHVFRTTDCGTSWQDISAGLPDIPVNALAIHPDDGRIIYAGTDIGMFITADGGAHWAGYNEGLPRVVVADLAIHTTSRKLRIASHGRSMWEIPLETPSAAPAVVVPNGGEVWMGRTPRTVTWNGFAGNVRLELSLDDGITWRGLVPDASGTSLRWNVADSASTAARIRVTETGNPAATATSASFTIEPFRAGGLLTGTLKAYPCWGLAYDGQFLWASVENSDTLLKIDRTTLATIAIVTIDSGAGNRHFSDIAYHPGRKTFFVHDITTAKPDGTGTAWLCEVTRTGHMLHRWPSPCAYPTGLAWLPNEGSGGSLVACDLVGDENFYVMDPDDGSTKRTIPRMSKVDFGPSGLAASADGKSFWQVIEIFDPNTGPHGSTMMRMSLDDQTPTCTFPLAFSPDSTAGGGYVSIGQIFARGVERDPEDGNLWVTNLDGGIYKVTVCDELPASAPAAPTSPAIAALDGNTPNPFTGPTDVTFTLARPTDVELGVYDALGNAVATLARGPLEAGTHHALFDPAGLPSGIYRCALRVEGRTAASRTMVYVR